MNFKVFLENNEITDDEIIIKLIPYLKIRVDWVDIKPHINYTIKLTSNDNSQYLVEYYTYGKLLQYSMFLDKKEIAYILREHTLNKILNEN